jgi:hypothetical protein
MNREVLLSILAMDSYHRDPTSGFRVSGNIGGARYLEFPQPAGASSSGFFASAYRWNGEKIISYAGTNDAEGEDLDKVFGWTVGAGDVSPGTALLSWQDCPTQSCQTGGTP